MSGPPSIQAPPEDGASRSSDGGGRSSSAGGTPAASAGSETAPSLHADVAAGGRDHHAPTKWLAMLIAGFLTLLVMGGLFPNLWYGMHDITDLPVYWSYAARIAQGEVPFTPSFQVEYPPLAVALFRVPGHTGSESLYGIWFNILMGAITIATGVVTAYVACRLWPRGGRAYVAAVLFPVGVALIGTIVINRYDVAVALLIAIFLLCLVGRWYTAAGFVLGMGFALKLTPLALLPLVLLLAGPPRRWTWPLVAFGAAAVAPFLPYLVNGTSGLWHVFQYHLERPLQIESVLGTPQLLGQLLGADWATWAWSHGSHSLVAPGVGLAADLSGGLTLLAVATVYLFAWLRRRHLRAAPADLALVVLALLLALMTFGKVLSPQYFIWILPAWALVAAKDRWIAVLGGLTLALTQAEFPALLLEPARHGADAAGDRGGAQHAAAGDVRGRAVAGVAAAGRSAQRRPSAWTVDEAPGRGRQWRPPAAHQHVRRHYSSGKRPRSFVNDLDRQESPYCLKEYIDGPDGGRATAFRGDERRVQAHRPVRDLKGLRQLGDEAPQDDVGAHPDHRVTRAGHADVGHVGGAAGEHARVARLHVGVRAEHGGDPPVQIVAHGDLLAGRLGVQIDDDRLRELLGLVDEPVDDAERRHTGLQKELAGEIDDGDLRAVRARAYGEAAAGRPGG